MVDQIESVAQLLKNAKRVCVLTGAGVSKESGIPTFRDAQTGLWAQYDPQQLASPEGFMHDPPLVWRWYDARRQKLAEVKPNPGHYAIAELSKLLEHVTVITQNVDGLHQLSGSNEVLELHGNITTFHCFDRGHIAAHVPRGLLEPPVCDCGSMIRPSVVWFGEALPAKVFEQAEASSRQCDLLFVVGTSGLVHPAASLPAIARSSGVPIAEINREQTPITSFADIFIQQESGKAFPEIVSRFKALSKNSQG